jgi:type VI secretion system protein ImpL
MDKYFQQSLAKYADTSKRAWSWRADSAFARSLSSTTLMQFQRAAQIRDAFFATGGNMPSISMQVFPPVLSGAGVTARFEVNGMAVVTQAGTSVTPGALLWPGAAAGGRTAIVLAADAAPTPLQSQPAQAPAVLEKTGAWSLFRLLDAAGAAQRGDRLVASFIVGGRELQYQIAVGTSVNPFTLTALREFRCPTGL